MTTVEDLMAAVQSRDAAAVAAMLERTPDLAAARAERRPSPLLLATYLGADEVADLLLARGTTLDACEAAARGNVARLCELLDSDPALVRAHSGDGWTPLHLAAHFGQTAALRLLLTRGAAVEARSRNGQANTALHAAAAGRHPDALGLLLQHGADVNATQAGGFTALHAAAQDGDLASIEVLLAHGADATAPADDGQTPSALAEAAGHPAAVERLTRKDRQE